MNPEDVPVPTWVLGVVWMMIMMAFLSGVIMNPSMETVMAAGAASLILFYIAFDYLYGTEEFKAEEMFE